jgi:hypothetical protein
MGKAPYEDLVLAACLEAPAVRSAIASWRASMTSGCEAMRWLKRSRLKLRQLVWERVFSVAVRGTDLRRAISPK